MNGINHSANVLGYQYDDYAISTTQHTLVIIKVYPVTNNLNSQSITQNNFYKQNKNKINMITPKKNKV